MPENLKQKIKVFVRKCSPSAKLPKFANEGDAGADCYIRAFQYINNIERKLEDHTSDTYLLFPSQRIKCLLGFQSAIPEGYYAQIVPRSGLALWDGLTILNSPGTIDAGFRNEWGAIVVNTSDQPVKLKVDDRICQYILRKLEDFDQVETDTLPPSTRGMNGFGSTGK